MKLMCRLFGNGGFSEPCWQLGARRTIGRWISTRTHSGLFEIEGMPCYTQIDSDPLWDGYDGEAACSIVIIANSVHLAILSDDQVVWPGSCWKGLLKSLTSRLGVKLKCSSNFLIALFRRPCGPFTEMDGYPAVCKACGVGQGPLALLGMAMAAGRSFSHNLLDTKPNLDIKLL